MLGCYTHPAGISGGFLSVRTEEGGAEPFVSGRRDNACKLYKGTPTINRNSATGEEGYHNNRGHTHIHRCFPLLHPGTSTLIFIALLIQHNPPFFIFLLVDWRRILLR